MLNYSKNAPKSATLPKEVTDLLVEHGLGAEWLGRDASDYDHWTIRNNDARKVAIDLSTLDLKQWLYGWAAAVEFDADRR